MKLPYYLTLASASAFSFKKESPLCSGAVKSLAAQYTPGKGPEYKRAELDALFEYQCASDSTCSNLLDAKALTGLKERMNRKESSVELFRWGYQIYVPPLVINEMATNVKDSCNLITLESSFCSKNATTDDKKRRMINRLYCQIMTGPAFKCKEVVKNVLKDGRETEGAILQATWLTATYPAVVPVRKAHQYQKTSVAILSQSHPPLCSGALKVLVQDIPKATKGPAALVRSSDFSKAESAALFEYYCSTDSTCNNNKDFEAAIAKLKERMNRIHSSVELFGWGYQIYVPPVVAQKITKATGDSCGLLTGTVQWCHELDGSSLATGLYCSIFTSSLFSCVDFIDSIVTQGGHSDGMILKATWITATYPSLVPAYEAYQFSQ